jgi:hypothetical protein
MVNKFDDIRPYYDSEIHDAMQRIVDNPLFENIVKFLYPNYQVDQVKAMFLSFNTVHGFQVNVMNSAIQNIIKSSSSGLSYSGIENLSGSERYLFLSNHRDILLDSAILQIILYANGHKPSEITFGDNLMSSQLIVDIGKSNKMFKLVRSGTPRQIFINSKHTSEYIRWTINDKIESIWIAQRNGRTKDGNDQTQQAVLKMFGMSGGSDFVTNYGDLNIVPLAISYEFDPGDILKTREVYISRRQTYVKAPNEDLNSILTGIRQFKGRIHLSVTSPISADELQRLNSANKGVQIQELASLIDSRVYNSFRLWNTNYIAYDLLNGDVFRNSYSTSEKEAFIDYMEKGLANIEGNNEELKSIFLSIYANPVVNYIKIKGSQTQPEIIDAKHFICK